ncbi:excinuclease ABC subunit UvrB [Mesomycoplasma lagogenitalium]|uniref:UvrABC system protein B n=1 Tax=Mesomycoplasma lagogenitalium TaxID=171286 RepID=A0ABY8LWG4_9BACT|nr:excinuclease ABC subunit UvrB [Mesomycoplasma lagogenitalium]WGI36596.1 excinuclease ABC subunit UvrB [Mesomycoplasma lagogenitalium]
MYKLSSENQPRGDQPKAIKELVKGVMENKKHQVLLGVTGSGKTFTMANVIMQTNRPAIILSHNKTLASQLYSEMKMFFPENKVEYFVSHFDYYRPESYLPSKDIYTEKSSKTNWDLEAMRMSAMNSLISRRDTIVISSVAAIYGALNPAEYEESFIYIETKLKLTRENLFRNLVKIGYSKNLMELSPGEFRSKGDSVELFPSWTDDFLVRIDFFDDEIETIAFIDKLNKTIIKKVKNFIIYPASSYTVTNNTIEKATIEIEKELEERLNYFVSENKLLERQRLEDRVKNDIDSLREFGFCSGIENYSRHMDGRQEGEKPYTLIDYLPKDALIFIDESHITIPQFKAMYNGDYQRKRNLVDYGFRLPSALDNRPLKFEEFQEIEQQKIYISATPGEYELDKTNGEIVTQIIRPTGLLDPIIEIKPTERQFEIMFDEIKNQIDNKERTIIITATKRTAEELSRSFRDKKIKSAYIHSEHKTFERNEILRKLRKGIYDVVVGVNLLREGIDLPEVSLIMILEADVNSFARSKNALIQMIGRVARNDHGRAILFADKITDNISETVKDNENKRKIQIEYNEKNNIVPKTIIKPISDPIQGFSDIDKLENLGKIKSKKEKKALIDSLKNEMEIHKNNNDFEKAIELRDLIYELEAEL